MQLLDVYAKFPLEADCLGHLELVRWDGAPRCPACRSESFSHMPLERRYHCNRCNTSYSVTVGTIFHKTKIPLQKWFLAIGLMLGHESLVTPTHLMSALGVNKNTATLVAKRIRIGMQAQSDRVILQAIGQSVLGLRDSAWPSTEARVETEKPTMRLTARRRRDEIVDPSVLPRATHSGDLKIADAVIKCFVLEPSGNEEPKRLLSGRAVTNAFGLSGRGQGMTRFVAADRIRAKMSERLRTAIEEGIQFRTSSTGLIPAIGYEAWILPELCFAVMDANEEKPLPQHQQKMVTQAKVLSRGFSLVGITALVDEATGYQEIRDRIALQRILEKYISREMLPYVRMFPDDFYKEMFRLLGWQWKGMSVPKPSYVGKLTDDLVYQRLGPGIRSALRELTPRSEKGNLKHKLHQHLTLEEGREALARHLHAVVALQRAAPNWKAFQRMVDRSFPRYKDTLSLPLEFGAEDSPEAEET